MDMAPVPRRELLISKGWAQAAILVFVFGFFVLGLLAYRTYTNEPPIPKKVVDPSGNELFTGDDIMAGQQLFLKNGLMQYGSIFGQLIQRASFASSMVGDVGMSLTPSAHHFHRAVSSGHDRGGDTA